MASLYRRRKKDGHWVWHVAYYLNGKHHTQSTGTADKRLAQEVLRKIEEDNLRVKQGLQEPDRLEPVMLSEFLRIYQENRQRQGKAPRTLSTDAYALERLKAFTGDCALVKITPELARKYQEHLLGKVKPASASVELRSLKAAFNWAAEKVGAKYLRANPFRQKGLIPATEGRTLPLCLSPEEKAQFFAAIDEEEYRQLFQFILLTGCRRGEALNLSWTDIDLVRKQLTFRRTKTKKDRTIPINLELMQIILALDHRKPRPFPYHPDWVSHAFKNYLKKAEISRDLHLHCLRHTAASDMVRAGIHLTKIQKFLGHSSVKVTEIYTHVLPEDLREAAEVLTCTG